MKLRFVTASESQHIHHGRPTLVKVKKRHSLNGRDGNDIRDRNTDTILQGGRAWTHCAQRMVVRVFQEELTRRTAHMAGYLAEYCFE
jgi:hypothetical protein